LITQLENQYGNDLLIAAMKVTAKNNKDNIGYVEGVLTKWEEAGEKDIDQAREFERQFKERMKKIIEKELESVQSISRLFQQLEETHPALAQKLKDSKNLQEKKDSSEERYKILSSISDACPYGKCDGTGLIWIMDDQENRDFMRECKCKAKRILSKKMKWARIPDEFQNVTINSFDISLYSDQASKEKSSPGTKVS
jgi:Replication initiation and membrane attachment